MGMHYCRYAAICSFADKVGTSILVAPLPQSDVDDNILSSIRHYPTSSKKPNVRVLEGKCLYISRSAEGKNEVDPYAKTVRVQLMAWV